MLTLPIFAPWRSVWDASLPTEARLADDLARRRNAGRFRPSDVDEELIRCRGSVECEDLLAGLLTSDAAFAALNRIWPLVRAAVWPRWLLLESVLDYASSSGSLHLAALALRTLIEELDGLVVLGDVDVMLAAGDVDATIMDRGVSVLRTRVLPRIRAKAEADLLLAANDPLPIQRPAPLQRAFDALGDYVHPSYGNHVLATRPHTSEAAGVLATAFLAVYEAFLSLPWAAEILSLEDAPPTRTTQQPHPFDELGDVVESVLAPMMNSDLVMAVASFRRQVQLDCSLDDDARLLSVQGDEPTGGAITCLLAGRSDLEHWPAPLQGPGDRLRYAALVRDEERLAADALRLGEQRAVGAQELEAWLSLLCAALVFAINLAEFRLTALARDAARMLARNNVIGATLAVRAIAEHHAVSLELGKKLTGIWQRLEKTAIKDEKIEALVGEAEKQVARVLAAAYESKESATKWRELWLATVRPYNVLAPIKTLDESEPGFLKMYGLLSHIVHGTVCTGGDLLEPGGGAAVRRQLPQLILWLAYLSGHEAMMDRTAPTAWMAHRLAALQLDSGAALGSRLERTRLPEGYKLKRQRDVFGSGTLADPFVFREGLLYHEAYARFIRQEGFAVASRLLHRFEQTFGDVVTTENGETIYFVNDTLPQGEPNK